MRRAVTLLAAVLVAAPGGALGACRLALLLALDMSSSVDAVEDRLQRDGLAAALRAPDVQAALLSAPGQPVALAVYEWSGRRQQQVILEWRMLHGPEDIAAAAQGIANSQRAHSAFPTAMGYALGYAARLFETAPACDAQTLDVSGDGRNNDGFSPALAYKHFNFGQVTVNGLAIGGHEDGLTMYFLTEVIKGPGAFVESASDFVDFERAIRRKLVRETRALAIGLHRPQEVESPKPQGQAQMRPRVLSVNRYSGFDQTNTAPSGAARN